MLCCLPGFGTLSKKREIKVSAGGMHIGGYPQKTDAEGNQAEDIQARKAEHELQERKHIALH